MQTEIHEFYFDENIFWQKPIFAGKNYFCQCGFYHRKTFFSTKPANSELDRGNVQGRLDGIVSRWIWRVLASPVMMLRIGKNGA